MFVGFFSLLSLQSVSTYKGFGLFFQFDLSLTLKFLLVCQKWFFFLKPREIVIGVINILSILLHI